uniref:Uncharacterized protein n=1 Tax=Romanomermis culicivorax TaxID=13658 RepID=A0A915HTZ8_ROMCU
IVASGQPNHPFGLIVYKDYLYWTDWILRAVIRVNKFTGGDFTFIRQNLDRQPMGLAIAAENSSSCDVDECTKGYSKKCQDYCTMNERGEARCHCFLGRKLLTDNSTCEDIRQSCSLVTEFTCPSTGACIPYESVCDSFTDCLKGEDESPALCSSSHRSCRHGFFKCPTTGVCKHDSLKCDGKDDCGDFSDETKGCVCNNTTQFQCSSGMCIPLKFRCDLLRQCNDASDEIECPKTNCSFQYGLISCNSTSQCISPSWLCDGKNDCFDDSDERNCKSIYIPNRCTPESFRCENTKNEQCIPAGWLCDDQNDCEDGSDEKRCSKKDCDQTSEFKCDSGDCIKKSWLCDSMNDCPSGEDEVDCYLK